MRRRDFIRGIAGSAASWPLAVRAQAPTRRIGVLWSTATASATLQRWMAALRQGLEQLGWTDGRNLNVDTSYATLEQLQQNARELVALNPDVLVATSTPSLRALRQATTTIPIAFTNVTDPIGQGFVASLARPGGNVTGFMNFESAMGGKWLEILLEISPGLAGVAVISNPEQNPQTEYFIPSIEATARNLSLKTIVTRIHDYSELDGALAALQTQTRIGMIVPPGPVTGKIVDAMARFRMPAIYWTQAYAALGGLVTYGTDEDDLFRQAAGYVDRILKGATPAELPVQAPTKFRLVVSLKTAKTLSVTIPATLLASADEVIE
jgi:putative tryptophan/tyrosine transport system substrate-binding protein